MTAWASADAVLPEPGSAGRILVLRTAQMAQVRAAVLTLRERYPKAEFGVLGTHLDDPCFDDFEKHEIRDAWVTPRSYRRVRRSVERRPYDLAVLCLNSDHLVGYGRVSLVVRALPARARVVAGYAGGWRRWKHEDLADPGAVVRLVLDALVAPLFLLVPLYLLVKPAVPLYRPDPPGAKVQEDRP